MINFRFHLVSLVSVFLALAIGLATGASIVNQGLVRAQKSQLSRLETRLRERGQQVDDARASADRWERFAVDSESRAVQGRLRATPVILLSPSGGDTAARSALAATIRAAGANVVGELTIEAPFGAESEALIRTAHAALSTASIRAATVRFLLRTRLRDALLDPDRVGPLDALAKVGFVTFRAAPGGPISLPPRLPTGARIVVVQNENTELDPVSFDALLRTLVAIGPARVVVAEAGDAPVALRAVRIESAFDGRVSTVDGIDQLEGRVATVLAIEDLSRQIVGDYGVDASAKRLVPAAA